MTLPPETQRAVERVRAWIDDYEQDAAADAALDGDPSHVDDGLREFCLSDIARILSDHARLSAALVEAERAIGGVIEWDMSRKYIVPYRVRDPLHGFLSKLQNDERRARTALNKQEARDNG